MGARRITTKTAQKKMPTLPLPSWPTPTWLTRRLLGAVIIFSVFGGALSFASWQLLLPTTLPIDHVQVKGEFRYLQKQALHDAIGKLSDSGFFAVDVHAIKQAAESLVWVEQASVRRIWPNTLQVKIIEQVPLARWSDGRVVNVRGQLIAAKVSKQLDSLPQFSGPESAVELLAKQYQSMSQHLAGLGLRVSVLSMSERRAWQVLLNNDVKLLLGRAASESRLARFSSVYEQVLAPRIAKIESVDLRYTNGFAVRWKAGFVGKV
jgi:cell division protein FtsQ